MQKHFLKTIVFLPCFLFTQHLQAHLLPDLECTLFPSIIINGKKVDCQQSLKNNELQDSYSAALFVRFNSFEARKDNKTVVLTWQTVEEVSSDYYIIERSINGRTYSPIATIPAKVGNDVNAYSYRDKVPVQGKSYYRIRQIDRNAAEAFSPVRAIELPPPSHLQIVQQPLGFTVYYGSDGRKEYSLFDMHGNRLKQGVMTRNKCVISDLGPGLYILSIQTQALNINTQVIIPK